MSTTRQPVRRAKVRETVGQSANMRIDREAGILRNVAILGPRSENHNDGGQPRLYYESARESAVKLFEGAKSFLDHRIGECHPVANYVGRVVGLYIDGEKVMAKELRLVNKAHRDMILDLAEADSTAFGLSIDAVVECDNAGNVTRFIEAHSVDVVAEPATNNGVFESRVQEQTMPEIDWTALTAEDLRSKRPDIAQAMQAEVVERMRALCDEMAPPPEASGDQPPAGETPPAQEAKAPDAQAATGATPSAAPQQQAPAHESRLRLAITRGVRLTEAQIATLAKLPDDESAREYIEAVGSKHEPRNPRTASGNEAGAFNTETIFS